MENLFRRRRTASERRESLRLPRAALRPKGAKQPEHRPSGAKNGADYGAVHSQRMRSLPHLAGPIHRCPSPLLLLRAPVPTFRSMKTDAELQALAARLFSKLEDAMIPKRTMVHIGDWRPRPNKCHENVSFAVSRDPRYKAVRGWIAADYRDIGVMKFFAHSVLEAPDGHLIDITPNPARWQYGFIRHDGTDEDFVDVVEKQGIISILYQIPR